MTLIEQLKDLGVPIPADGSAIDTKVLVHNVDQLRKLFDTGLDDAARSDHHGALFDGVSRVTAGADGLVARVEDHIHGAAPLADADRAMAEAAFPLTVHVLAAPGPVTISGPTDLSTSDGSLRRVEYTDVTIEQGGYFTCSATPLLFTCTTLTRNGDSGNPAIGDFNILGRTGPTPDTPGTPGAATQAAKGKDGECSSAGIAGSGGQRGTDGSPGTAGTDGGAGGPGVASQAATITISQTLTASSLMVNTQSGPGGKGGDGGNGGAGQQGGNGGDGATCDCTGNGGGPGANGGAGGAGGRAGDGGNGTDAAGNVVVRVPTSADVQKVVPSTQQAPPGAPGTPGTGGAGGAKGTGGGAGKHNSGGGDGGSGTQGATGAAGSYGTHTGVPAQILARVN